MSDKAKLTEDEQEPIWQLADPCNSHPTYEVIEYVERIIQERMAQAWDEGLDAGHEEPTGYYRGTHSNPYGGES